MWEMAHLGACHFTQRTLTSGDYASTGWDKPPG